MGNTLTLHFSDRINIDDLIGNRYRNNPADRERLEAMGIDVAELEAGRRAKAVIVHDLLAHLILAQLREGWNMQEVQHYLTDDRDGDNLLALTTYAADE
jgi:hypothetical protein